MHVRLKQGHNTIYAEYQIDPIDLIVTAHLADYGVTVLGDSVRSYQIIIEANPNERARFNIINGGCCVYRSFSSGRELAQNLTACLPELYQYAQEPGAYFTCVAKDERAAYDVLYKDLNQLTRFSNLHQFERHYGGQRQKT